MSSIDLQKAMESLWRQCVKDVEVSPKVILVGRHWAEMANSIRAHKFPRCEFPLVELGKERPQFPAWRRHWTWWNGKSTSYWVKRRALVPRAKKGRLK